MPAEQDKTDNTQRVPFYSGHLFKSMPPIVAQCFFTVVMVILDTQSINTPSSQPSELQNFENLRERLKGRNVNIKFTFMYMKSAVCPKKILRETTGPMLFRVPTLDDDQIGTRPSIMWPAAQRSSPRCGLVSSGKTPLALFPRERLGGLPCCKCYYRSIRC